MGQAGQVALIPLLCEQSDCLQATYTWGCFKRIWVGKAWAVAFII